MQTIRLASITNDYKCSHNWIGEKERQKPERNYWFTHLVRGAIQDIKRGRATLCFTLKQLKEIRRICNKKHIEISVDGTEKEYYYLIEKIEGVH